MDGVPAYDALRSYATHRREHGVLGPFPQPIARIANRRLWLRSDVETWLSIPIPEWRRSTAALQGWIKAGRPRDLEPGPRGMEQLRPAATLSADDGRRPTAT